MLGTNDSFWASDYLQSFQSYIDRIFATWKNGPRVIACTALPQLNGHTLQNQIIETIINPAIVQEANKFGYDLLDTHSLIQQQPNWQNYYAADGIHIWGSNGFALTSGSHWLLHTLDSVVQNDNAAIIEWSGNSSNLWQNPVNWSNGNAPTAGDKVRFGNQTSGNNLVNLGTGNITVGSMVFTAGESTSIQASSGAALIFDNSGFRSTIDVEGANSISVPILLDNDLKLSGNGSLSVHSINGNHALIVQSGSLSASSINVDALIIGQTPPPDGIVPVITVPEPTMLMLLASAMFLLTSRLKRIKDCLAGNRKLD